MKEKGFVSLLLLFLALAISLNYYFTIANITYTHTNNTHTGTRTHTYSHKILHTLPHILRQDVNSGHDRIDEHIILTTR